MHFYSFFLLYDFFLVKFFKKIEKRDKVFTLMLVYVFRRFDEILLVYCNKLENILKIKNRFKILQ